MRVFLSGENLDYKPRCGNHFEGLAPATFALHTSPMLIGIFLILLGSLLLLDRVGIIDVHMGNYIIPIVFIAIGAAMVIKQQSRPSKDVTAPPAG